MALRRDLFPVTEKFTFLNNAAESPLNRSTEARIQEYLATALSAPHTRPAGEDVRREVRRLLAELLGGAQVDYALVSSTCQGLAIVANGLDWQPGDNVVVPASEHWSNTFPWLALQARGVEVRFVPLEADNSILPERVEALVDQRTRVVAHALVQFSTGFRADLPRLSAIAHAKNALLVIDGIQGAGCCPVDMVADGVDVFCAGGFKWLLGMPGTGFVYIAGAAAARIRPTVPGMFAAGPSNKELVFHADARRFESGSISYSLFHGWAAGLAVLKDLGVDRIFRRNMALSAQLLAGLAAKPHLQLVSPSKNEGERSQVVVVTLGSAQRNGALCARLLEAGVVVANRSEGVRISPNFYNTEEEVERLLSLL